MEIQRILANNPGPFTGPGTNTWLLDDGGGHVIVIDPGPVDKEHRKAIENAVAARAVVSVLVTHNHLDHAPMANPLASSLSVAAIGHAPGPDFEPDVLVSDGDQLGFGEERLTVIHTPGHSADHLCFRVGNVLFSGDHIIGGSSVMVEEMGPYLDSLEKIRGTGVEHIFPGHGDEIDKADEVIDWYVAHRRQRHQEVLRAIEAGARTIPDIVGVVYAEVDPALYPLAARSVSAHLRLMSDEGRIAFAGEDLVTLPPQAP